MVQGIANRRIAETPIAILDFETTGLTAGLDRVVEVCIVRQDPGGKPCVALDSLVNPLRPVSATEIHGITDADVADAPSFQAIAGDVVEALSGCAVCAYNVYFDIKFLAAELATAGVRGQPPHFCLMYMRPMLGLGARCKLGDACREHSIDFEAAHVAAHDVQACAQLLELYLEVLADRGIETYADLASLKAYKFTQSFAQDPLSGAAPYGLRPSGKALSRSRTPVAEAVDDTKRRTQDYWDALRSVLADLEVTEDEIAYVLEERRRLKLPKETVRLLHARAFTSVLAQFTNDQWLDDKETVRLRRLKRCLSRLGWAPGD
jgi:DNA polymerase-3 subunit epsilon